VPVYLPLPHGITYRFRGFVADCRIKSYEEFTLAAFRSPRPKRKAQEIKLLLRIFFSPTIILTIKNVGFMHSIMDAENKAPMLF